MAITAERGSAPTKVALALAAVATAAGLTLLGFSALHHDTVPSAASQDHPARIPTATAATATAPPHRGEQGGSRPAVLLDHRVPNGALPHGRRGPRITLPGHSRAAPIVGERIVDGVLGIPADVQTVGWDVHSASLDSARGSTVLAGHVNYVGQGSGYFSDLQRMRPGQIITTSSGTGDRRTWRITTVDLRPKHRALPAALFDPVGPRQLVLISCGGPFDRATGSYLENVIVVATPHR